MVISRLGLIVLRGRREEGDKGKKGNKVVVSLINLIRNII